MNLRWGRKNGISKLKAETYQEYVKKNYQAAIFGSEVEEFEKTEYKLLINKLKGIRIYDMLPLL